MTYYVLRPHQGLVLDVNLRWKKAGDCSGHGPGIALGLDTEDALNLASWVSQDKVSAVPYPEETAISHLEQNVGQLVSLRKKVYSHSEFVEAVKEGVYPEFLLRKPLNKTEKKLLIGHYQKNEKRRGTSKNKPSINKSQPPVSSNKKDLRGDEECSKGVENVYYIVNTKRGLFLNKSLAWVHISALKDNKKLKNQLFCVREDITAAQTLSQWVTPPGEMSSPCTPSTLKRKFKTVFPNPASDSLTSGIRSHKYPSFLGRKPESRREIAAFQLALRDGLVDLEERTLLSLGQIPDESAQSSQDSSDVAILPSGASISEPLVDNEFVQEDALLGGGGHEFDRLGFHCQCVPVAESSEMIHDFLECAMSFGKMLSEVSGLVAQKQLDLEMVHRQLIDLDHVAEFYSLNASDGYRLNKTRKEFLQKRRVIKNELVVLELVSNCFSSGATPSTINRFINCVLGLDRRSYTTRVMTVEDIRNLIRNPKTQDMILGSSQGDSESRIEEANA